MKHLTINARPQDFQTSFNMNNYKLDKIYSGRLDNCRCGCAGRYFTPAENEKTCITKLNQLARYNETLRGHKTEIKYQEWTENDNCELKGQGKILTLEMQTNDSEEKRRGLTFYFKKK